VKEDLLRDQLVKSDAGPVPGRTVVVVKMNFAADFQTGTYNYHQMASVFFERTSMDVLKESTSHTELCGITTVRVGPHGGRWMHEAHSYWDGEAERSVPLVWPKGDRPHLYWDGLPVALRRRMFRPVRRLGRGCSRPRCRDARRCRRRSPSRPRSARATAARSRRVAGSSRRRFDVSAVGRRHAVVRRASRTCWFAAHGGRPAARRGLDTAARLLEPPHER
jgi:hypothetical protein